MAKLRKTKEERVRLYLDKCDQAIAGARGHDTTYSVACSIVNGFDLCEEEAIAHLLYYNTRCDPPWSERELRHKVREALKATHDKPRGHFLKDRSPSPKAYRHVKAPERPPEANLEAMRLSGGEVKLPEAMKNPTAEFLKAAFFEDETICVEPAIYTSRELQNRLNGDASFEESFVAECIRDKQWPPARPRGKGIFKTREEWIKLFEKDPDAAAEAGLPGVFVVVNPFPGGSKKRTDDSIEQFRHVLLEFDSISKEAQWSVIKESNVPCSVVLDSGGKSVHAWVRVDAATREEYDERAKQLFDLFATYKPDVKCGNPSRLSRLPGARRGDKDQTLLATDIGDERGFREWANEKISGDDGMIEHSIDALLDYVPSLDKNNLVGRNWLKREGSLLLIGASGIGKSSLVMQMAISWALGRPLFGLQPVQPLKVMLVQAENDEGDLAEQFQGVLHGLDIDRYFDEDEMKLIRKNLVTFTNRTHVGKEFVDAIERRVKEVRADIVIVDPLLSFIGDDISKQEVCSRFLRQWLNPVSAGKSEHDHKFAWVLCHHTNKPKGRENGYTGTISERAYSGAGSAELTNWARAVLYVEETPTNEDADRIFTLYAPKRASRSGLESVEGRDTDQIWIEHNKEGKINWNQRAQPDSAELPRKKSNAKIKVSLKPRGRAKAEVSSDWIESKIGDFKGSRTALSKRLAEAWDQEGDAPSSKTFERRLKESFAQDPETLDWRSK